MTKLNWVQFQKMTLNAYNYNSIHLRFDWIVSQNRVCMCSEYKKEYVPYQWNQFIIGVVTCLFIWMKTFHKAQLKFMRRCYPMSTCEWKSSIICEANIDNTISHLVCCSYIKHSWLSNISSSWARTFYKFSYFCYYLETLSILMNKISLLLLWCYTWFQNMNFG